MISDERFKGGEEHHRAAVDPPAVRPRTGLVLVTCDRPDYFRQSFGGAIALPVDTLYVIDDGERSVEGEFKNVAQWYVDATGRTPWAYYKRTPSPRSGVGIAKNIGMELLLRSRCDWILVAEDDIVAFDSRAVTGYVDACQRSGYEHLCFGPHGPHNQTPIRSENAVDIYPHMVGAWTIQSRRVVETVGLIDEELGRLQAMDHVEWTVRVMQAGFTHCWPGVADAAGSKAWLSEIPGSIEQSAIPHAGRGERITRGMVRFKEINPDGFHMIWPNR